MCLPYSVRSKCERLALRVPRLKHADTPGFPEDQTYEVVCSPHIIDNSISDRSLLSRFRNNRNK